MVVVTEQESGPYWELATEIAADRDTEVTTDVDPELLRSESEVLLVNPAEELDERTLLRFQRQHRGDGTVPRFSIVTGRTVAEARSLYYRTPPEGGDHGMMLVPENRERFAYDDDATVATRDDSTVEYLEDHHEEWDSLSMLSNGRMLHTFLADGYVCGFPTDLDVLDFDGPYPHCVADDGERDCPLPGDILHADRLSISHLFIDSCASMIPGNNMGTTGLPVHAGMSLLSNAVSLIGGYRPYDGTPQEIALHYDLLRAGYDAAERCHVLNRNAETQKIKSTPFVTFGRPEASIPNPTEQAYESEIRADGPGRCLVELTDLDAHVVDLRIPRSEYGLDGDSYYLRNLTDEHADAPLYYAAFEAGDDLRVLIYTWGKMQAEELRFTLDTQSWRETDLQLVGSAEQNAAGLDRIGFLGDKSRGQLKNLRNHVAGLPEHVTKQRYHANGHRDVDKRLDLALGSIETMQDRLVSMLDQRGPAFLSQEYAERTVESNVGVHDDPCVYCGRPVFVKRMSDVFGRTSRSRGICPKCLNVFDVPVLDGGRAPYPTLDGDLHFDVNPGEASFEMSFTNPFDSPMTATYHPWLHSGTDEIRGKDVFEMDDREFTLDPNATESVAVTVDTTDLPEGEYPIYGYVVGNLDVFLGVKVLTIART